MIQVKLLACLSRCYSSEIDLQTITSTRASHGASIIFSLSLYRAAYGVRHEYWLGQACFVAAVAMVHDRGAHLALSRSIATACELLLSFGDYLPAANRHLWTFKTLARQLGVVLPKACARLFSILAARDRRTILTNVNLVNVGPSQDGIGPGVPPKVPCDFIFSGLIGGFQPRE